MLKKHNKLVILLVLATFMFSIVGTAGAASFSDVSGTKVESDAIYKLNSLGIIDGYPDGTFGPEKTITRAEFAKIACAMAGLESVASGMANSSSIFSDVSTDFWGNGWINVAAAQGYVKGDPNGTFRPNDQVKQSEVITVFLRLLGYNDNLEGVWPADYIAKAANLGILDDITFVSEKPATRGEVAVMGSETLDENVVEYIASDNYFDEKKKNGNEFTLLADKFDDSVSVEDALLYDTDLSDGKVTFHVAYYDDDDVWQTKTYELNEDCVIGNAPSWNQIKRRVVDFVLNDDDEIINIQLSDYPVITLAPDDVKVTAVSNGLPSKIELDGKTYDCDENVILTDGFASSYNAYFTTVTTAEDLDGAGMYADKCEFALDEDDEIIHIKVKAYPTLPMGSINSVGVIEDVSVNNCKINLHGNAGSIKLDEDDTESWVIMRNHVPASLEDLEPGDLVYDLETFHIDNFVYAVTSSETGTLEDYEASGTTLKKLTIDGKTTKVALDKKVYLSTDDGDSFDLASVEDIDDILDQEVTAMINPMGKIAAVISGEGTSNKIHGVVNDDTANSLVNGKIEKAVEILTADDKMVTYAKDEDSEIRVNGSWVDLTDALFTSEIVNDAFVELTLNSDGYIDQIRVNDQIADTVTFAAGAVVSGDKDEDVVSINGITYDTEDVVVFNTNLSVALGDDDEVDVIDRDEFMDDADDGFTSAGGAIVKFDGGELEYLVIDDPGVLGSDNKVAVITRFGTDSDGDFVYLMTDGDPVKYSMKGDLDDTVSLWASGTKWKKGVVAGYEMVSGDVRDTTFSGWNLKGNSYEIDEIDGKVITLIEKDINGDETGNTAQGYVDADTLYWDASDDLDTPELADIGDVSVGDLVKVYREEAADAIDAIEIIDDDDWVETWYGTGTVVNPEEPAGTYTIADFNAFTKSFTVSVSNLDDAAYFNVFNGTTALSNDPVAIDEGVVNVGAVFADTSVLTVEFYSDAAGATLVDTATLSSGNLVF